MELNRQSRPKPPYSSGTVTASKPSSPACVHSSLGTCPCVCTACWSFARLTQQCIMRAMLATSSQQIQTQNSFSWGSSHADADADADDAPTVSLFVPGPPTQSGMAQLAPRRTFASFLGTDRAFRQRWGACRCPGATTLARFQGDASKRRRADGEQTCSPHDEQQTLRHETEYSSLVGWWLTSYGDRRTGNDGIASEIVGELMERRPWRKTRQQQTNKNKKNNTTNTQPGSLVVLCASKPTCLDSHRAIQWCSSTNHARTGNNNHNDDSNNNKQQQRTRVRMTHHHPTTTNGHPARVVSFKRKVFAVLETSFNHSDNEIVFEIRNIVFGKTVPGSLVSLPVQLVVP